ncbi:hypothetical protein K466DRAFT_469988, partial [Polyporus arcularius HHB13444]
WCCLDCLAGRAFCSHCCHKEHLRHPLHRVEFWNGTHFISAWLRELHVRLYLGHEGLQC